MGSYALATWKVSVGAAQPQLHSIASSESAGDVEEIGLDNVGGNSGEICCCIVDGVPRSTIDVWA